jgi:hypothetical protein
MLLEDMKNLVDGALEFVRKFQEKSYFLKAWKRSSDTHMFAEYNRRFNETVMDLNLGLNIDTQALDRQEREDARRDIEQKMALVQQTLRAQGELTTEMLQELQSAQQNQLRDLEAVVVREFGDMKQALQSIRQRLPSRAEQVLRSIDLSQLEYREERDHLIGEGGCGAVYRGTYLHVPVAVKVIAAKSSKRC